jgi:hypothetical protein
LPNFAGIVPANINDSIQLRTNDLYVADLNGGYGRLNIGPSINMQTSTSAETYSMGFNPLITGSISSFVFSRIGDLGINTASLYISSLYFGDFGGSVSGELTTDATATDLFWKGSKINGAGVTLQALQSTVGGLATASYVSTLTLAQSISSFSTTLGPGGGVTAEQLTSTATRWATYPAVSSIVFANDVDFTRNEIVSPGQTLFQLVTETQVLVTTSTTVDGITPLRGLATSQLNISDQINLTTFDAFNYSYNFTAGQLLTGTISTPTITNGDNSLGSLYVSSVYLAAPENAAVGTAGALTTDATATKLFYSTNQLANVKVNVVVSSLGADNPQLFSEDIGKYFLFSTTTALLQVNLPSPETGWNAVIKNLEGSTETFTVNAISPVVLAPGVVTTVVCDGLSFYSL